MSKKLMLIQFFVVSCLILSICLIGVKQKDFTLSKLKNTLVKASKQYIKDNKVEVDISNSFVIYIDELISKNYITDDDNIDKYCLSEIVYFNGIFQDEYRVIENCKINKE